MDTSSFDEGALSLGNKVIHVGSQSVGHDFGDDLRDGMNQTNGAKVRDVFSTILFQNKGDIRSVQPVQMGGMKIREAVYSQHDISLNYGPTRFEEGPGKAIRTRCLIAWH